MTVDEWDFLAAGVGWKFDVLQEKGFYVGNIKPLPRLQLPPLNLQDAAQGFRTQKPQMVGEVTGWPCSLAAAATFDDALVLEWGHALGKEHATKGALTEHDCR